MERSEGVQCVQMIRVTGAKFHTASGITTLSSFESILKSYPNVKKSPFEDESGLETLDDDSLGIAFQFRYITLNHKTVCYGIIVHKLGSGIRRTPILNP
jgi:hypothetical protein